MCNVYTISKSECTQYTIIFGVGGRMQRREENSIGIRSAHMYIILLVYYIFIQKWEKEKDEATKL